MAGMPPPQTPEQIARAAGFPLAGAATVAAPTAAPLARAPAPVAALKAPSAGQTEIFPGAMDWIKQLVVDALPTRAASASALLPPAPLGANAGAPPADVFVGGVRGTPVPPQAQQLPWYQRFAPALGLVPTPPAYGAGQKEQAGTRG